MRDFATIDRRKLLLGASAFTLTVVPAPTLARGQPENHVVLLGDSIFDNAAYVGAGPDLIRQVRDLLPAGWRATLNAKDGAVVGDIAAQLQKMPADATHLVVSVGGNDALREAPVLDAKARSVADALELITVARMRFRSAYARMLDHALGRRLPMCVCTIYEPRYPEAVRRSLAATALTVINDAVTREAFARDIDLIDLRIVCDEDRDFANPIEPSVAGGAKIARSIISFALLQTARQSRVIIR
jgi:hypothetical protein